MADDLDRLIENLEKDYPKVAAPSPPVDPLQKCPDEHLFAARLKDIILGLREIRRQFYLLSNRVSIMEENDV